jgi:hypothetical protein
MCAALLHNLQVLVAVRETVWVVDDHGATDQPLPAGCGGVAAMAVSPNGAFVALACNDGRLRVMMSGKQVGGMHACGLHSSFGCSSHCGIALTSQPAGPDTSGPRCYIAPHDVAMHGPAALANNDMRSCLLCMSVNSCQHAAQFDSCSSISAPVSLVWP